MSEQSTGEQRMVAGLLRRKGRVLLVHRSPRHGWYPDTWDLPNGHVRKSETSPRAVKRELRKVLGIAALVEGEPFAYIQGSDFRMDIWLIDRWEGEPGNRDPREHDALAWLTSKR